MNKEVIIVKRSGSLLNKQRVAAIAILVIPTVMAALLLLFLTTPTFSAMRVSAGSNSTLEGRVVAVQNMSDLTVLTIQTKKGIGNDVNVLVAPYTKAQVCSYSRHAMDINPGNNAVIKYHMLSGLTVADKIVEKC